LLRGPHRSLVEAMPSTDDPIHLNRTVGLEDHVEYYIALNSKIAHPRCIAGAACQMLPFSSAESDRLPLSSWACCPRPSHRRSAALHYAALSTPLGGGLPRHSESGTGHVPRTPLRLPYRFRTLTAGQCGEPRRFLFVVLLGFPYRQTVRIAKHSGLHFVTGAVTVAGAALPVPKLLTFTSSRGASVRGCVFSFASIPFAS